MTHPKAAPEPSAQDEMRVAFSKLEETRPVPYPRSLDERWEIFQAGAQWQSTRQAAPASLVDVVADLRRMAGQIDAGACMTRSDADRLSEFAAAIEQPRQAAPGQVCWHCKQPIHPLDTGHAGRCANTGGVKLSAGPGHNWTEAEKAKLYSVLAEYQPEPPQAAPSDLNAAVMAMKMPVQRLLTGFPDRTYGYSYDDLVAFRKQCAELVANAAPAPQPVVIPKDKDRVK